MENNYINKYLKYKFKYIKFKNQLGGDLTSLLTRFLKNHESYPNYNKKNEYDPELLKSLVDKIIQENLKDSITNPDEIILNKTIKLYFPFYIDDTNILPDDLTKLSDNDDKKKYI